MSKKRIALFAGAALAALAAAALLFVLARRAGTVRVAFYGVDQRTEGAVKSEIEKMDLRRVQYFDLDASAALPKKIQKKYSLLIAKNSLAVKDASKEFIPVGEGILEALPIALRKAAEGPGKGHYALPILLDHFEIAYNKILSKELSLEEPKSYGSLLRNLAELKNRGAVPLVCAGADDRDLLGFASAMAEVLYGSDGYQKALGVLRESLALNKSALPEALTRVLDEIKAMQESGLLFDKWTKTSLRDIRFFMQEREIGAVAMFLDERRDFEYNLIKRYDSAHFPRYDNRAVHGIIAPQIVAALLSSKNGAPSVLARLAFPETQGELSNKSLLAPVASRAEAVDRQADDVRFWAASSSAGALGTIADECCVSEESVRDLAAKIRVYLEN